MDYKDKWVIVTGAGKPGRVGAKIAEHFASKGANIYIHYRSDKAKAEEVRKRVLKHGTKVELIMADLSKPGEVAGIFEKISPDIVINNAAIFQPSEADMDRDKLPDYLGKEFYALMENISANTVSSMLVTQAAAYRMRKDKKRGVIVLMGDSYLDSRQNAYPINLIGYTVSKTWIPYTVQQLGHDLGKDGIRVVSILNGPIEPPPTASKEAIRKIKEEINLPDDLLNPWIGGELVAEAIDSIIQARAINASPVRVDGGRGRKTEKEH